MAKPWITALRPRKKGNLLAGANHAAASRAYGVALLQTARDLNPPSAHHPEGECQARKIKKRIFRMKRRMKILRGENDHAPGRHRNGAHVFPVNIRIARP